MSSNGRSSSPHECRGVLVVDDNEAIRTALSQALREDGREVATAKNGRQALEWLRIPGNRPCLILLDLMMPIMDGRAFREAQLCDPALAEIPVILLTADGSAARTVESLKARACLAKPIRLDALLAAIAEVC